MNESVQSTGDSAPRTPASPLPPPRRLPSVPQDVLHRFGARVLDPSTAVRVPGQPPYRSTVYVADRLIINGDADDATRAALAQAAEQNGVRLVYEEGDREPRSHSAARAAGLDGRTDLFSTVVDLVPTGDGPATPPNAWQVLQTFRTILGRDAASINAVALDHLMAATAGPDIGGNPFIGGHAAGGASDQYGTPGYGGRAPVDWVGPEPTRCPDEKWTGRRPVVAVLDTGVGRHPWLGPDIVTKNPTVNGTPIGLQDPSTDPELTGVVDDPYEGTLDSDSGHGTFIAGLIRQKCPDANIVAVRVMSSDGAVAERELLDALKLLVVRQHAAQATGDLANMIDVVCLSLGYYHEQPEDITFDPVLLDPLRALGECGVAVVVSAGNDATSREMFPAAFAPHEGGEVASYDPDCIPVLSVGALNPNRTVALFSNAGDWVTCHRPGAAVVSTFPVTFDAGQQPLVRVFVPGDGWRETIDPDSFHAGFGTWSGTSFSAPILAGEIMQAMVDGDCGPLDAIEPAATLDRAWKAIAKTTQVTRP